MINRHSGLRWLCAALLGIALYGGLGTPRALADDPKPDPAGTATGSSVDAQDASGTHFVVTAPADLSDDDKKDPAKVKAYNDTKKAFDDYTAQAKLEPLAVKLSDSVGHQLHLDAGHGFPRHVHAGGLRTRGDRPVPREKRGSHHVDEFHDLPHGHARVLRMWFRLYVRWHGRPA